MTDPDDVPNKPAASLLPMNAAPDAARLLQMRDLCEAFASDAASRHAARLAGKPFGAVSGFAALNDRLGGAFASGVNVLHGSPGVGKTAFALQVAALCGCPALFVTCEISPLELLRRHTARVTNTDIGKFKNGEIPGHTVLDMARRAAATAPMLALLDATQQPVSCEDIEQAAAATRSHAPDNPYFLIVLDSLHTWADRLGADAPGVDEYARLNMGIAALQNMTARMDCPLLAIVERNRESMKAGGQSAGAGTRKIEYGAEVVLELHADTESGKPKPPDENGEIGLTLVISKNRNGMTGRPVPFRFYGKTQRYQEEGF